MERRLAAILAADVVGFSRLMGADEAGTLATLKAHREDLIDPTLARHKGRVVKLMGDGALVEFASVTAAVECAVAIQEAMADRNADLPDGQRMDLRIGINLGDVIVEGDDLYGDGVNVAARLESQAEPGGICVSAIVRDQVTGKIPQSLEDLGEQALKNIEAPVRVYRVVRQRPPAAVPRGEEAGGKPSFDVSPGRPPSIAILPFKNLSGNPDQDHIADGLRLGILSTLVQLPGLFLVGARVMDDYRGKDLSAAQVGGELGVRYVLDGAVQLAGNRVRATLQLTDSEAQEIVWAERYDRVLDDLFEMQDEITQEVVISLDVKLLGREHDRLWFTKITEVKAKEYFLRGISHLYSRSKADNAAARRMFESFYHAQPDLVFGPGVVALTHWLDAFNGWTDDPAGSKAAAVEWARKAVEYDMNTGFGHVVLGHLLLFEGRHEEALANCREGAAIRTSCPLAHGVLASALTYCGDPQEAVASARRSLLIERVYPPWVVNVLATAYRDGEMLGLSIPAAEEAIRLDPRQTAPRLVLSSDYGLTRAPERARRAAAEVVEIEPSFRLSAYGASQPYKDPATLERLIEVLREAGLPD